MSESDPAISEYPWAPERSPWVLVDEINRATQVISLVLQGKKPAAIIDRRIFDFMDANELTRLGMEIDLAASQYALARKGEVTDSLSSNLDELLGMFNDHPEIQERVRELWRKVKQKSLAEALGRVHGEILSDSTSAHEALIEGVLMGYPKCDIEYYVRTRFFKEEPYAKKEVRDSVDLHFFCPECAAKLEA